MNIRARIKYGWTIVKRSIMYHGLKYVVSDAGFERAMPKKQQFDMCILLTKEQSTALYEPNLITLEAVIHLGHNELRHLRDALKASGRVAHSFVCGIKARSRF